MTHGNSTKQHAMAKFGEVNYTGLPAIEQPSEIISVRKCQGLMRVEIDLYSETGAAAAAGDKWDVDQWEREMIVLEAHPSREAWYDFWRAARALLHGWTVTFPDGDRISRASHLAEARA